MDDGGAGPGQQGRDDETDALARTGRRERHDVLGTVVAQIVSAEAAEQHAGILMQPGGIDLAAIRPARRSIGGDVVRLARAPQRPGDRGTAADETAGSRQRPGFVEHGGRIGVVVIPPREQRPGTIDRQPADDRPGCPEFGLVGEHRRCPLRRCPHARDHESEDDKDLADQQFGGRHGGCFPRRIVDRSDGAKIAGRCRKQNWAVA